MTYTYQVKAVRGQALSDGSNEASVTIPQSCTGASLNVSPVHVAVTAVPIVVTSTTADYFVLFVRPNPESYREIPISVTLGEDGPTTLTERLAALSIEHYRVEKYHVATPGDVMATAPTISMSWRTWDTRARSTPPNRSQSRTALLRFPTVRHSSGSRSKAWSVVGPAHLNYLEFVKFFIYYQGTDRVGIYFQNTETHRTHYEFREAAGILGHQPDTRRDHLSPQCCGAGRFARRLPVRIRTVGISPI